MNKYTKKLDKHDKNLFTVKDFREMVKDGSITDDDGFGYWVKDGKKSNNEVFSTSKGDATHVVWYNK